MPPKFKFTKQQIIAAALEIVRLEGVGALTARSLAKRLGSSAKPIFSYFEGMQQLQDEVFKSAYDLYGKYINSAFKSNKYPPYKASGMAYIEFAGDEKQLFKWLFMRDRTGETITEDREEVRPQLEMIMENLGIDEDRAYLLHIEMWVYVHGIATMIATSYLDLDTEFVSRSLTDVYSGLKRRFTEDESK